MESVRAQCQVHLSGWRLIASRLGSTLGLVIIFLGCLALDNWSCLVSDGSSSRTDLDKGVLSTILEVQAHCVRPPSSALRHYLDVKIIIGHTN